MLKDLIKLSNELDQKGLVKEADTLDSIIKKALILKVASETSLDAQDKAEQKAASKIGQRLVDKLNITPASVLYKPLVSVGNYPSFKSWAQDIPEKSLSAAIISKLVSLSKAAHTSIAAAFGIPALAEWSFDRMGEPEVKLRYFKERLGRTVAIEDFSREQIESASSLTLDNPKIDLITGTPPPLVAYVLKRGNGDISELKDLRDEGIVNDDVYNFVNTQGSILSDKRIALNSQTNKIIEAMRELYVFEDLPT